jgi:hypothetical protein
VKNKCIDRMKMNTETKASRTNYGWGLALALCATGFPIFAQVDWTPSTKAGIIQISGSTTADFDIDIARSKASAGIKVFNGDWAGRSIILFGQTIGGRYGYISHHGQSYVSDTGYGLVYPARSTTLTGSDANGLTLASQGDMRFTAGGTMDPNLRMVIASSGNVGIGFTSPALAKLQVAGTVFANATRTNSIFTGNIVNDNCNFVGSEGYWALRTATDNSYNLDVYNSNSPLTAMTILQNGRIGVGTAAPDEKLTVKGKIHTSEVRVDMQPNVAPDYVFEKDYNLLSLSELESYIKANKHLPEVPSAKEMEANGMNLKEMNLILLKKVEELTLHLIELKKENLSLKKNDEVMEKMISDLQNK